MDGPDGFCFAPEVTAELVAAAADDLCREHGLDPETGEPIATPFGTDSP